jgi:hypothetical protein
VPLEPEIEDGSEPPPEIDPEDLVS